jgi:hypothetical protein
MATENRGSTQDMRIENVFASQDEPGAADATILRRDLLAGAALVLLGSASGCGHGSTSGGNASAKRLRTDFMKEFTAKFIGDPGKIRDPAPPPATDPWPDPDQTNPPTPTTRVWPSPGQNKSDAVADYQTFVTVLLYVALVGAPPPATSYPNSTLGASIMQFLQATHWPSPAGVPNEYLGELPTVYLVEIAVIQDRLLQAINSFDFSGSGGTGGTGSNWPPH